MDILCEPPFSIPQTFDAVDDAIDSNADISEATLVAGLSMFSTHVVDDTWKGTATPNDVDKARSTIRQLYCDWSSEGLPERHASHTPIVAALEEHLPSLPVAHRHRHRILVPGAGLGRLVFELCIAGYTVEGNEISYHQLIASNCILYGARSAGQHKLYPWALSFNNHLSRANQMQCVKVPDVLPSAVLAQSAERPQPDITLRERMLWTAGDFCELYRQPLYQNAFDAVTTCFFIDTSSNLIDYIETVKRTLKPNGVWVNIGPLLWHFEATPPPMERERHTGNNGSTPSTAAPGARRRAGFEASGSVELSNDEVLALLERFKFDVIEHTHAPAGATGYIQDPRSMLQNVYQPAFWVARKR
ncbi:hypothetical protein LTR91_024306 [Friedmanniomyces endolithicus]|uniref:carnosine N-methyltransferase n=1 Tax=Friedmanniomyces endolithicus TaxID=329885 RepID=A0A4U0USX3_9PEZI|nr:hypothetical protein LTS09_009179 [Friedmanniomyces endolithicus]KAK0361938.1 hypothetical protein LTR94_021366 [Friedmanniomyces endolithicus]KAK0787591.1 hypothetical protein LTR59_010259 [Friedmanniomyces endolithicus]KAK0795106.1 hypothetical protein LTR38_009029 [Friedmanniomyces endolithicus]KAK0798866.1 hypothetical protein LTR75_009415 [Friedmanniomyces endolithicus]